MSENREISMRIASLSEKSFRINMSEVDNISGDVLFSFSCGFTPDFDSDILELDFGVRSMNEDKSPLMECVYRFIFEISNLSECVKDEGDTFDVGEIAPHVFSVAIGTMRGVIAEKTARTELSKYPLPIVNPMEVAEMLSVKKG